MDIQEAAKIILNKDKDQNGDLLEALKMAIENPDKLSSKVKAEIIKLLVTLIEDSAKKTKKAINNLKK